MTYHNLNLILYTAPYPVLGVGVGGVKKVPASVLTQQGNRIVDLDGEERQEKMQYVVI